MADFDNNGSTDLAFANGAIRRASRDWGKPSAALDEFWKPYAERNQIFLNDGNGGFRDASPENDPFCLEPGVSRGLLAGDFDSDGGIDLLVTRISDSAKIYRNIAPKRGHWLLVRAIEPALKRDAYGAKVTVSVAGTKIIRWLNPGYSYLCSNDPRAHFGLGQADKYDSIEVIWPDGKTETFPGGSADRLLTVKLGEGKR
jgi:hypothetical protein